MTSHDTRILFFTRRPEMEARVKKLVHGRPENQAVIRHLYTWAKHTILDSGISYEEVNELRQRGQSFGEKITNGVQDLIEEGVSNIIIIGNDSPNLQPEEIAKAAELLEAGNQVIGHTLSGGAWIIGICAEKFDRDRFNSLPWQTSRLGTELASLLESQGAVATLKARHDLNDALAFAQRLSTERSIGFWKVIKVLLAPSASFFEEKTLLFSIVSYAHISLRAPPASL